jgi:hypothetical protein
VLGRAPSNVRVFTESDLLTATRGAGLIVETVERHGVKGKDVRAFMVARRPG